MRCSEGTCSDVSDANDVPDEREVGDVREWKL
ncbi:hypothetical protein Ae706Ps2_6573c [Pseudonocardia sp. Ae706_Ps2]|nr:hypothetical protein Ae706Ps2_6573c [Pseudonocardia sp. Ae706_Ps2]